MLLSDIQDNSIRKNRPNRLTRVPKSGRNSTSVAKDTNNKNNITIIFGGGLKETELPDTSKSSNVTDTSLVGNLYGSQSRREKLPNSHKRIGDARVTSSLTVPVVLATGIVNAYPTRKAITKREP